MIDHLIIVAGHAPFNASYAPAKSKPDSEEHWALFSYQRGEVPFYIEHIRSGVLHAQTDDHPMLVFTGGRSRPEAGRWSEAATYREVSDYFRWWTEDDVVRERVRLSCILEEYSRDSFENLLFSICAFQKNVGYYPPKITMVSWKFKAERFEIHRKALHIRDGIFHFIGANNPKEIEIAEHNEARTREAYLTDPYGILGGLHHKRMQRDPFRVGHPYGNSNGLEKFFRFYDGKERKKQEYDGTFPWEIKK